MDKFEVGDMYFDNLHSFNVGVDMYYLLLSYDKEEDGEFWWRCAKFMKINNGFKGGYIAQLKSYELNKMELVGSICGFLNDSIDAK